ncbi:hydrogenase expression/formation protein HypE [bacterium]|nr:hydrogenase expression/formation protein HypE [candidate division CSSED10-310 bacterium]
MNTIDLTSMRCPLPLDRYPRVVIAHGGGGRLMHQLIRELFQAGFGAAVEHQHDSAVLTVPPGRLAFTTDSYVITPLEFPGGDIGRLAVFGTVNDLAMSGARPLYLSAGFILEEGLSMETLWRIACSMGRAAREAGVAIVTGDTKVVERGRGDGIYINTAGVGLVSDGIVIEPAGVRPGQVVLVNGDIGRHGMAIMADREGLRFESTITSDLAALHAVVAALLDEGIGVACLRDLTRGGLAGALIEIAQAAGHGITLEETAIPVRGDVAHACELLGLDPLYVANEGRFAAFIEAVDLDRALHIIERFQDFTPRMIGVVTPGAGVTCVTAYGGTRKLGMLSGEQMPRIC